MNTIDLNSFQHFHLIGIGGVGLSAIGRLLVSDGKKVTGTEDNPSPETLDELRAQGVRISLDLNPEALPEAECYIYSDAWLTKHPAVIERARHSGVPTMSYAESLGLVANNRKVIAVAGAHGKTTTTAMMVEVFEAAGLDPAGVIGSLRVKTHNNFRAGQGDYFIVEADEYRRHFLFLQPFIFVILNIDEDHLDYYKNVEDIQSAFREVAQKVPLEGFVVCDTRDPRLSPVIRDLPCTVVDYRKYYDSELPLKVLPLHRINAAAVLAVADIAHIDSAVARGTLADFAGTWRRFEYKGEMRGDVPVYDDYGHHPTEVKTTLESIRAEFPDKRIVIAFHPHLFSRTKLLFKEFTEAFDSADDIVIAPIFAAREDPDPSISNHILAEKIRERGKQTESFDTLEEVENYLRSTAHAGDMIVTMGAGDIYKVADNLVRG